MDPIFSTKDDALETITRTLANETSFKVGDTEKGYVAEDIECLHSTN
tara:strand:- start:815 stop:955 length:141 start_codon:yes stop_codon:yes gene_type:complete